MGRRARLVAAPAAAVLLGLAGPAVAQDCLAEVDAMAGELGLATEPAEPGDAASLSDRLAQSGGVIEPPADAGATPVIEPPAGTSDAMPTAPAVAPDDPAARRDQVEGLLMAARAAAEAGDEEACEARLAEAAGLAAGAGEGG
jgi:hypothetical protein